MNISEEQAIDLVRNVFTTDDLSLKEAFDEFCLYAAMLNADYLCSYETQLRKNNEELDRAIYAAVMSILPQEDA
jgi:hypothetical protein